MQLEGVVKCDAVRSNASGTDVVDSDPNVERAELLCRDLSRELLRERVKEPTDHLRAQVAKRLMDDTTLDTQTREVMKTMPLFPGPSGERWSIAALEAHMKHGRPLWGDSIAGRAKDLCERSLADALIVTGSATGEAPILDDLEQVRRACHGVPILVGSGVTPGNAAHLLPGCRGVIAGTGLKVGSQVTAPIDRERVAELVAAARAAWSANREP